MIPLAYASLSWPPSPVSTPPPQHASLHRTAGHETPTACCMWTQKKSAGRELWCSLDCQQHRALVLDCQRHLAMPCTHGQARRAAQHINWPIHRTHVYTRIWICIGLRTHVYTWWKWYGYLTDRIRDRIRLESFNPSVLVRILNIWYRIHIAYIAYLWYPSLCCMAAGVRMMGWAGRARGVLSIERPSAWRTRVQTVMTHEGRRRPQ